MKETTQTIHATFQYLPDKDKLLESVHRISSFLTSPSHIDDVLKRILDEVVDTMQFDRGIVCLFDDTKENLITKVVKNYSPEEGRRAFSKQLNLKKHDCLETRVAKFGHCIILNDVETDPKVTETDRKLTKFYKRGSTFCDALKVDDNIMGIIALWHMKRWKFSQEEINILRTFTNQISLVLHTRMLFENDREKIRELLVLQKAVSELSSDYALDRMHEVLMRNALRISSADRALIYFLDLKKKRSFINDGKKVYINEENEYNEKIEGGIIKKALDTGTIEIRRPSSYSTNSTTRLFDGYLSEIVFPMKIKDKFKGALYLGKVRGNYSRDQINVLDILVKNAAISYDNAIMHSKLSLEARSLKTEVKKLKEREDVLLGFQDILGKSKKMLHIFHVIQEVAKHDTSILIQGESGTGKELIARAIHRHSGRSSKPFVDVNCAAIPGTLLESELFGYETGAFTDAKKRKIGLLEHANGGTLLLDEVGEMSSPLQAKLLRVLEDNHIRRLGGREKIPINVRFIFSTNRNLSSMVAKGSFREDLFYRISVVPIIIPPLRERDGDIILLTQYYVDQFNKKFNKKVMGVSRECESIIEKYSWPGNVRELKNIVERIMILQDVGAVIEVENLPAEIKVAAQHDLTVQVGESFPMSFHEGVDYRLTVGRLTGKIKEKILSRALKLSGGNKTAAAKLLGISRYSLIRELKKLSENIE
jgi:transcriptional regulator with GAF, ATPase, and Fis domain